MTLPGVAECRACHGATSLQTRTPASSDCMDCHGYHVIDWPPSASFEAVRRTVETHTALLNDAERGPREKMQTH
jgi:hypothetical protein